MAARAAMPAWMLRLGWPIDVGQGPETPALGAHVRALGPQAGQR